MPLRREDGGSLSEIGAAFREDGGALTEVGAVYREEGGSLTQVYSAVNPPANLAASFDNFNDEVDLSWDPASSTQDIWRCQGGSCDPTIDGVKVDTVSAGVGSYSDTGPTCDGGRTWSYQIEDNGDGSRSNIDSVTEPPCFQ